MWSALLPVVLSSLALTSSFDVGSGGAPAPDRRAQIASAVAQAPGALFPAVSGDLELTWGENEPPPSLMWVLQRYAALSGQRLLVSAEIRQLLESVPTPLEQSVTVPAAQVQSFVETLIADKFVLSRGPSAGLGLLYVHSVLGPTRASLRALATQTSSDRTALMRAHPAVWFTTMIELSHIDPRTLSNSLRVIITDPNVMLILPVGESSLVVCGQGPWVADLVDLLRTLDVDSKAHSSSIVHATVRLSHADAIELAPTIELALAAAQAQREGARESIRERRLGGAIVQACPRINAVILTCTRAQLEEARNLIAQLDVE